MDDETSIIRIDGCEFDFGKFPYIKINKIINKLKTHIKSNGMYGKDIENALSECRYVLNGWTRHRYPQWETPIDQRKLYDEFFSTFLDFINVLKNSGYDINGLYTGDVYRYIGKGCPNINNEIVHPIYDNMFTSFSTVPELPSITSKLCGTMTLIHAYIDDSSTGIRLRDFIDCPEDEVVCRMSKNIVKDVKYINEDEEENEHDD